MKTYSYNKTPVSVLRKAFTEPYACSFTGETRLMVIEIVNQGIDSHLEAFTESTFSQSNDNGVNRLECLISPKDMLVFLRRLAENASEEAQSLRSDILESVKIEEI